MPRKPPRPGVTFPGEPPLDLDNPLDLRNPTPSFRVPGMTVPDVVPRLRVTNRAWERSVAFVKPETVADERAGFLATLAQEDADLRAVATALRLRGYTLPVIAQGLGVERHRIQRVLRQSRADGNLDDVLADLTTAALPLAMEKLLEKLEAGERWAISETLRGGGVFRTYTQQAIDATTDQTRTLDVNLIMPTQPQLMNPRGIVGAPRLVEGQVIDASVQAVQEPESAAGPSREGRPEGVVDGGTPRQG